MPVPDFSPGEVLTAAAMDSIGLWLVKTQTVGAGVASVTVSDVFSADYDAYRIIYTGGTATAQTNITFKFNGSPLGWFGNIVFANFASGTPQSIGASNLDNATYIGAAPGSCPRVVVDVQNPFLSQPSFVTAGYVDSGNAGASNYFHSASTSYTGFILTPASGTFTGGTIRVYGYRN
jgi:hypothetical protein